MNGGKNKGPKLSPEEQTIKDTETFEELISGYYGELVDKVSNLDG